MSGVRYGVMKIYVQQSGLHYAQLVFLFFVCLFCLFCLFFGVGEGAFSYIEYTVGLFSSVV